MSYVRSLRKYFLKSFSLRIILYNYFTSLSIINPFILTLTLFIIVIQYSIIAILFPRTANLLKFTGGEK